MMVHHSDGVWVLDVAEKHVALGIAHKTDIRVFELEGSMVEVPITFLVCSILEKVAES